MECPCENLEIQDCSCGCGAAGCVGKCPTPTVNCEDCQDCFNEGESVHRCKEVQQ